MAPNAERGHEIQSCASPRSSLVLFAARLVELPPVREHVFLHFKFEVIEACLHPCAGIGDGLVVDAGADLLEEEVQQRARRHVPDRRFHVLGEVALDGLDGLLAFGFVEFDGHGRP